MIDLSSSLHPGVRLRAIAGGLLLFLGAACSSIGDGTGPTTEASPPTTVPSDSAITPPPPTDSSGVLGAVASLDTRSSLPGIVFATDGMQNQYFSAVYTGAKRGGGLSATNILPLLSDARAKGARIVLKLSMGEDKYIQNSDRTFSLTKWKALVDRFKSVALDQYIQDGTILGHFLIDEPHRAAKWGGQIIPQATVEAMAMYSKQIWPTMTTFVHTQNSWLANSPVTFTYLDATWVQFVAGKGDVTKFLADETSYAKSKGLGLMVGMNVLNGGNGSSGIRGTRSGQFSMSASELRTYGSTLLNATYACGFILWAHNLTYYGRSDIQSAMADLSSKAKAHVKTSCQQ